ICRFAYALVLPDMRDSLGWSYSVAGVMNTLNAAGYLAGALGANVVIRRFGMLQTIRVSTIVSVLTLVMFAFTDDLVIFGCGRLLSGVTGAFAMVAGSAIATSIAQAQRQHQAYYVSLFYLGPAIGILISGFIAPFFLEWHGAGSWWITWGALAAISASLTVLLLTARVDDSPAPADAARARIRATPLFFYLIGYFLFGAGYIAYMTFMIAYVRNVGGGALAQSAFWTCIGVGALVHPWTWSGLMAKSCGGGGTALLTG